MSKFVSIVLVGLFFYYGCEAVVLTGGHCKPSILPKSVIQQLIQKPLGKHADDDRDDCEMDHFKNCNHELAEKLGLENLDNEQTVANALNDIVAKDLTNGFAELCKLGDSYLDCLGPSFNKCISLDNLENNAGLDHDTALAFIAMIDTLQYECGPAYTVINSNFNCLIATQNIAKDNIEGCSKEFRKNIILDPKNICRDTQEMVDCIVPYYDHCGAQVKYAICGTVKTAFKSSVPQCKIECEKFKGRVKKN